jgi:hypothetical protein
MHCASYFNIYIYIPYIALDLILVYNWFKLSCDVFLGNTENILVLPKYRLLLINQD